MMERALRHAWIICANQVRRVLTDRGTPIWLLALPLALIGVLGMCLQPLMSSDFEPEQPFQVVLVETDSEAYQALTGALHSMEQYIAVTTVADVDAARDSVLRRTVDAAVIPDPVAPPAVTVLAAPGSVIAEMLESVAERAVLSVAEHRAEGIDIARTEIAGTPAGKELPPWLETDAFTYYAVGITAMFVMFAAHAVGVTAVTDRATDAYARLRSLGVKPAVYMIGGSVASIVVSVLYVSLMAAVSSLLFGVTWGHIFPWTVLTLVGAAAAAGLSLVVMALVPKPEHIDGAGSAIFNVLAFLGGSMSPLMVLPEWFRTSFSWLPNRAMLNGYLKASVGANLADIAGELTTLLVAAIVLFVLGGAIWTIRAKGEV